MRYALIHTKSKKVVNVIELEDGTDWKLPTGHKIVASDDAEPGGMWDGTVFTPAPEPPPNPRKEARDRAIEAIETNKDAAPWGRILYDLAVADGRIEV